MESSINPINYKSEKDFISDSDELLKLLQGVGND